MFGVGAGRERLVDLDRADVGQAAGGERARAGAELAGGTGDQGIGAGERRIGDVIAQGDDAVGVEQAAASRGVDRGEDGGSRLVLAVAGDAAGHVAAEHIVTVAEGDGGADEVRAVGAAASPDGVAGDDAVGDFQ